MEIYGSDKPDTRFGVELKDLTDIAANCGFKAFSSTVENKGLEKAVVAPGVAETFSRKILYDYEEYVKRYFGATGLATLHETQPLRQMEENRPRVQGTTDVTPTR